jgi:uncharacterized protein (UPF0332 family)
MAIGSRELHLLTLVKSKKDQLNTFKQGVFLEKFFGKAIDDLHKEVCAERYNLGKNIFQIAKQAMGTSPNYRLAIGRSYYSMYHCARAVVYFSSGGDDYEEHSALPKNLPGDFPDRDTWINDLKTARLERNKADYDPYPDDRDFKSEAEFLVKRAEELLAISKVYLRGKGLIV